MSEAIKLLEHLKEEIVDLSDNEIQAFDLAIKALEERPQGKWKFVFDDKVNNEFIYKCSECGREVSVYSSNALIPVYPFCHCGADMRKGGAE